MEENIISEGKFNYIEFGEGNPIVILHGLMGGLSNFSGVIDFFPKNKYKIIIPKLPLYDLPVSDTKIKTYADFLDDFIKFKKLKKVILLGNSLGGHIALVYSKYHGDIVNGLVLTGSSGLYENSMGDSYPQRGNYEYIKKKSEEVFLILELLLKKLLMKLKLLTIEIN